MSAPDRAAALGAQLRQIHEQLTFQVSAIRRRLATGAADRPDGSPKPDLLQHCLAFCGAVSAHHTAEDGELFPALLQAYPEFAATLGKLQEDHRLIADILKQVQDLLGRADSRTDRRLLIRELDGLTAILQSHFAYEERSVLTAARNLTQGRSPDLAAG